jgi:TnpA family transposase
MEITFCLRQLVKPVYEEYFRFYSTDLERAGSYSKKNRLYQAFLELGKVIRTMFLLEYISNARMRQEITAITNIVEKYHHFLDWVFFGKDGIIAENDPIEQEKRLKYLDLVASAVILQNTVDMSLAIQTNGTKKSSKLSCYAAKSDKRHCLYF